MNKRYHVVGIGLSIAVVCIVFPKILSYQEPVYYAEARITGDQSIVAEIVPVLMTLVFLAMSVVSIVFYCLTIRRARFAYFSVLAWPCAAICITNLLGLIPNLQFRYPQGFMIFTPVSFGLAVAVWASRKVVAVFSRRRTNDVAKNA